MSHIKNEKSKQSFIMSFRRQQVATAYLTKSRSAIEICRHLGIPEENVGTIKKDIQFLQESWKQSAIKDFDLARAEIIQGLQKIYEEAWEGWRRSQSDGEITRVGEVKEPGGTKKAGGMKVRETNTSLTKEKRDGDPRFLNLAKDALMKQAELLGLTSLGKDDLSAAPPLFGFRIVPIGSRTDDRTGTDAKPLPQIEAVDAETVPPIETPKEENNEKPLSEGSSVVPGQQR